MRGRIVAIERPEGGGAMAALVAGGKVRDLLVDPRPDDPAPWPEEVHWARVERVVPGLGAAFLALAGGATGWLRAPDAKPGEMRLVQVSRWAEPRKASPLTDRPIWKGRLAIATPGAPGVNVARSIRSREARERLAALSAGVLSGAAADFGLVLRSAAADAAEDEIAEEIAALREAAEAALAEASGGAPKRIAAAPDAPARALRDWAEPGPVSVEDGEDAFERLGVWDAIEAARAPRVALRGGGAMTVEATTALVAVDVDTGEDFSKNAAKTANLEACAELPRQLRLRGLGGAVVVDPAPVRRGARQGIDKALKDAFAMDPVETQFVGWTPLGHIELTRRRERRPLSETLDAR